jgi:hypothetical protein
MFKKRVFFLFFLMLCVIGMVLISCVTATPIPPDATPEQIDAINAVNIAATATNTSTLAGFQIAAVSIPPIVVIFLLLLF